MARDDTKDGLTSKKESKSASADAAVDSIQRRKCFPRATRKHPVDTTFDTSEILAFPKTRRPEFRNPGDLIKGQRCLVCGVYGATPYWLQPKDQGGQETGDNLMPLCKGHSRHRIVDLYRSFGSIRSWIDEHDRYDVMVLMVSLIKKENEMSKYYVRVHRKDMSDHAHKLPNGTSSGGALMKPESVLSDEQKNQRGWHTHLYQHYGKTYESMPAHDEPGHTHDTEVGPSAGPQMLDTQKMENG